MGITVKELCKKFTNIKDSEIAQLVGKKNFTQTDTIPLNNFAKCNDLKYKNFAAEREGQGFIKLLKGQQQVEVAKNAGISLQPANTYQNPFDITNQNKMTLLNPTIGQNFFKQSLFTMRQAG